MKTDWIKKLNEQLEKEYRFCDNTKNFYADILNEVIQNTLRSKKVFVTHDSLSLNTIDIYKGTYKNNKKTFVCQFEFRRADNYNYIEDEFYIQFPSSGKIYYKSDDRRRFVLIGDILASDYMVRAKGIMIKYNDDLKVIHKRIDKIKTIINKYKKEEE